MLLVAETRSSSGGVAIRYVCTSGFANDVIFRVMDLIIPRVATAATSLQRRPRLTPLCWLRHMF